MISAEELKSKPVKELRLIAQSLGMDASQMKKSEIVSALLNAGEPDPEVPENKPDEKPQKGRRGRPPGSKNKKKADEPAGEQPQEQAADVPVQENVPVSAQEGAEYPAAPERPQDPYADNRRGFRPDRRNDRQGGPRGYYQYPQNDRPNFRPNDQQNYRQNDRNGNGQRGGNRGPQPRDPQKYQQRGKAFQPDYYQRPNAPYRQNFPNRYDDRRERLPEAEAYERDPRDERDVRNDREAFDQPSSARFDVRDNGYDRDNRDYSYDRNAPLPDSFPAGGPSFNPGDDRADDGYRYAPPAQPPQDIPENAPSDPLDYLDNRNVIAEDPGFDCYGILEINQNGFGFLRAESLYPSTKDIFVAPPIIKKYMMRTGDIICGKAKMQSKSYNAQYALVSVTSINSLPPEKVGKRPNFDSLVPIFPDSQYVLETVPNELSTRIIDMFAPIGKGQRGLIVSPPKAGKTVLLKKIAAAIRTNYPEVHLIILLIDERPEEVTDIRESVDAMVVASTFDEMTSRHIAVSEFCLEHAQRLVEMGSDVVILMDSITRLARAYNQEVPTTGRSLSGGLDPGALYKPKKFFGSARNIKGGGSLTIIATALVDTGSRLDDVIYEEFKGTGNMELHLDRGLAERRVFPSIDIGMSGTRKEELLLSRADLEKIYSVRRAFSTANNSRDVTESLLLMISKTSSNKRFLETIRVPDKTEKTFLPSID
ncbi:MAG: transcription termination factor Rho [Clostridia bacterium]|nr:transcription termination factor Rho [Clostridia bacterium]